jgi:uncharacterized protein (UPF0332 family)
LSSRAFEPKAFYDLAAYIRDKLTYMLPRGLRQAADRTCISRAYYAAFLSLRDAILALPIRDAKLRERIERTNDAHAIVAGAVKRADLIAGNYLELLRKLRNRADYETDVTLSSREAARALRVAGKVIDGLAAIASRVRESDVYLAWVELRLQRKGQAR